MARRTLYVIRYLTPAVILVIAYWFFVLNLFEKGVPIAQAKVQFYFLPFVLIYLGWVSRIIYPIQKRYIFLIFLCGLAFTGFSDAITNISANQVIFAPLKGDELASKTRLILSEYQSAFGKNRTNKTKVIYDRVGDNNAALALLSKHRNTIGLVWGDSKNLRITLGEKPATVTPKNINWLYELSGYKMITQIPNYSAGIEPLQPTMRVVSAALIGSELDMLIASKIVARWRTTAARSYLFFRLGNSYLLESLDGKKYQFRPIDCAVNFLEKSLKILKPSDSPELRRAILNNLSLALLVRGNAENGKEDMRKSRQYILLATREPKKKNVKIDSIQIARQNAKVIASFAKNGGFKRKTQ